MTAPPSIRSFSWPMAFWALVAFVACSGWLRSWMSADFMFVQHGSGAFAAASQRGEVILMFTHDECLRTLGSEGWVFTHGSMPSATQLGPRSIDVLYRFGLIRSMC